MSKLKIKLSRTALSMALVLAISPIFSQAFTERSMGTYGGTVNFTLSAYDGEPGVKGSPYLDEEWKPVKVFRPAGDSVYLEEAKINGYDQNLVFLFKEKQYRFPPHELVYFVLGGETFVKRPVSKSDSIFCKQLFIGEKYELLSTAEITMKEGKESIGYMEATPPSYERKDFLVLKVGNVLHQVQLKKKKVKLSPENSTLSESLTKYHVQNSFETERNFVLALEELESEN